MHCTHSPFFSWLAILYWPVRQFVKSNLVYKEIWLWETAILLLNLFDWKKLNRLNLIPEDLPRLLLPCSSTNRYYGNPFTDSLRCDSKAINLIFPRSSASSSHNSVLEWKSGGLFATSLPQELTGWGSTYFCICSIRNEPRHLLLSQQIKWSTSTSIACTSDHGSNKKFSGSNECFPNKQDLSCVWVYVPLSNEKKW